MNRKPVILWTCDVIGWAYYNRIMRLSAAMPEYDHRIWFFGNKQPIHEKQRHLDEADVIVCQGVKAVRIVHLKSVNFGAVLTDSAEATLDARFKNVVLRLDSMRVDLDGEYYDIWTGEKLPG